MKSFDMKASISEMISLRSKIWNLGCKALVKKKKSLSLKELQYM